MRSLSVRTTMIAGLILGAAAPALAQDSNRLGINVGGLRNDNGVVRCGLFASVDGFRQPGREFRGVVAPARGQNATCVFSNLPAGTYAVAVFHAEHNETQMKTGMFGKPEQGYASRAILRRPSARRTSPRRRSNTRAGRSRFQLRCITRALPALMESKPGL